MLITEPPPSLAVGVPCGGAALVLRAVGEVDVACLSFVSVMRLLRSQEPQGVVS